MLESHGCLQPEDLQELDLDVSIEELLSAERAFTYPDLSAILGNESTVVWMTPHAAVMPAMGIGIHHWMQMGESCRSCFTADG